MRVFNHQSFSHLGQGSVCSVEKCICTYIIHWSDPFSFQYPPERFSNVQMWRIRWQIEKEKSSFLPYGAQLTYFMIAVYSSIIKHNKRVLMYTQGEIVQKTNNLICSNTLSSSKSLILVFTIYHPEDIESCYSLGWDAYLFIGQLPAIGYVSFSANMAFISIVEGNTPFTFLFFKFLQLLVFVCIELRRGDTPWTLSYTSISCANEDKKRLNVRSLASFPVDSCQANLALLTLCLSCSIARRTAASSEQSRIGFRPRPGRVSRPVRPSPTNRFTQAFTDTKLISVCSPAFAEDRPSAFRRTARQRMRKQ